jgi:hypothetical protein
LGLLNKRQHSLVADWKILAANKTMTSTYAVHQYTSKEKTSKSARKISKAHY